MNVKCIVGRILHSSQLPSMRVINVHIKITALFFLLLIPPVSQAFSAVIWDNLASNYSAANSWTSPNRLDSHIGADDFYLEYSWLVTGADIFVISPNQLSSWDGDISWWFFEESFYQETHATEPYPKPGKIIKNGEAINITTEYQGETPSSSLSTGSPPYSAYKVSFMFDNPYRFFFLSTMQP